MVRLRGSLDGISGISDTDRGSSGGGLEGVYDFARWLFFRPSALPKELVPSWRLGLVIPGSAALESSGTI